MEVRVHGNHLRRLGSGLVALSLVALQAFAGTAAGGNTRGVFVGTSTDGVLGPTPAVSAGEQTSFTVTVRNAGNQTLNHVMAYIGADDDPTVEANPQATYVPTLPVAFPAGVTATAAGCSGGSGAPLTCVIATLGKGESFSTTVVISTTTAVLAQTIPTKAIAYVAEIGNDNGANKDTFAAEGSLTFSAFSCDAVSAYRALGSKTVSTPCGLSSTNKQQSTVVLPSRLTTITLSEGASIVACPAVSGLDCIGDAVFADIAGDATSDVVTWTLKYDIAGLSINTNKLVVYHYNDQTNTLVPADGIALTKKDACKNATQTGCGSASVTGTTLTIVVQTSGNGKIRLLG
jgi:hypothetical protein